MKVLISKSPVKRILVLALALVFISGSIVVVIASLKRATDPTGQLSRLAYGKPVIVSVACSNGIYKVTDTTVAADRIGSQIGTVTRQVSPRPLLNGDIARNTTEGPALIGNGGGKLFALKDVGISREIAVELLSGQYYLCDFLGKLP